MPFTWIREPSACWDANKQRIIAGARPGVFDTRYRECCHGDPVPGDWWRVEDAQADRVVGYGWLDVVWGDAEILLATDPELRGRGIGSFILSQLDREASLRGLGYIYNTVRPTHPDEHAVKAWLTSRGFQEKEDGRLVRRVGIGTR